MTEPVHGVPWCRSKDYNRLLEIFEDSFSFPATYNEWIDVAEAKIRYFEGMGKKIVKVPIDPTEFMLFCNSSGQKRDAEGRRAFVRKVLLETVANRGSSDPDGEAA
jgi:hypothetical protein